jgi:ABC-type transporter Mla subunit MlaD
MRSIALVVLSIAAAACAQKSPEQQQLDQIRSDASNQAKAIGDQAELQAAPLDQQADALSNQAQQAGGYTGKRLQVKADALQKEAKLIREQADRQGDAIKEAADARVKARGLFCP